MGPILCIYKVTEQTSSDEINLLGEEPTQDMGTSSFQMHLSALSPYHQVLEFASSSLSTFSFSPIQYHYGMT